MTDDKRIIRDTPIGNIQAYPARPDDCAVTLSFYASMKHAKSETSYISQNINLTATDAYALANALLAAADHADMVQIVADLGLGNGGVK